jgi:hypothetical protein
MSEQKRPNRSEWLIVVRGQDGFIVPYVYSSKPVVRQEIKRMRRAGLSVIAINAGELLDNGLLVHWDEDGGT